MEEAQLYTLVWLRPDDILPPVPFSNAIAGGKSVQLSSSVLVVDDERLIADTLTAILEEHGFTAIQAYNGEEALKLAMTMHPDVVLSDVLMPGISGVEMAIRMKQMLAGTKIVLLSGQASTAELIRQAANAGHDFELLAKPIHPEELVSKLKQLLQPDQN
jgi:DNA-binding response OmpR family regulator